MDATFLNTKNANTSDQHRLALNATDQINVKRRDKYVDLSNLSIFYTRKNIKKS